MMKTMRNRWSFCCESRMLLMFLRKAMKKLSGYLFAVLRVFIIAAAFFIVFICFFRIHRMFWFLGRLARRVTASQGFVMGCGSRNNGDSKSRNNSNKNKNYRWFIHYPSSIIHISSSHYPSTPSIIRHPACTTPHRSSTFHVTHSP